MRKGWEIKTIGEVCKVIAGQSPEGKYYNDTGNGLPFYQGKKEYGDKYIGEPKIWTTKVTKEAEANDILISVRAPVGPINLSTQKICIGRGLAAIRASKFIEKEFLYYFLMKHENEIVGNTGAVFNSINKAQIEGIKIPVPPLSEQQEIVSILDDAFESIERAKSNAEQNLKNVKELLESYLQKIFENKGEDWEEKTLGEIGKVSMCKRVLKNQTTREGDIPFYKIGTFGKTPDSFISNELYKEFRSKYPFPKKGDILVSASGTIGRSVIYDDKPAYFQDSNIVWINNNNEVILNEYLFEFYGYCDWNPSKGATISRLYNDDLRRIKISYPKSKENQRVIVQNINEISEIIKRLESIYLHKLNDLEELKKSILQKAFNGKLKTSKISA